MATSLAAATARRAAALARLSPAPTRAASLIRRRGFSGAAESHEPPSSADATSIKLKYVIAISAVSFITGFKSEKELRQKKEARIANQAK